MSRKPYIRVDDDGECYSGDGIPCPHCHHVHTNDIWEVGAYSEEGGEMNCWVCDKPFTFSVNISYSWKTQKDGGV